MAASPFEKIGGYPTGTVRHGDDRGPFNHLLHLVKGKDRMGIMIVIDSFLDRYITIILRFCRSINLKIDVFRFCIGANQLGHPFAMGGILPLPEKGLGKPIPHLLQSVPLHPFIGFSRIEKSPAREVLQNLDQFLPGKIDPLSDLINRCELKGCNLRRKRKGDRCFPGREVLP